MEPLYRRVARALDALLRDELDRARTEGRRISREELEHFSRPRDREARWPLAPRHRLVVTLEVLVGVSMWHRDAAALEALDELQDDSYDDE